MGSAFRRRCSDRAATEPVHCRHPWWQLLLGPSAIDGTFQMMMMRKIQFQTNIDDDDDELSQRKTKWKIERRENIMLVYSCADFGWIWYIFPVFWVRKLQRSRQVSYSRFDYYSFVNESNERSLVYIFYGIVYIDKNLTLNRQVVCKKEHWNKRTKL